MPQKLIVAVGLSALILSAGAVEGSLVAYYNFDGDTLSERLEEKTGQTHLNLTEVGANPNLWDTRPGFGHVLANENQNRHLRATNHADIQFGLSDFSVSLWSYRTSNVNADKGLLDKFGNDGKGYQAQYRHDNTIRMLLGDNSQNIAITTDASYYNPEQWQNIIFTVDRTNETAKIYVNGTEAGAGDISALGNISGGQDLWLARMNDRATYGFVDDYGFFDHVLTSDEIAAINFNGGLPIPQALAMVPEPSTIALAGLGLLGLAGMLVVRRRRRV